MSTEDNTVLEKRSRKATTFFKAPEVTKKELPAAAGTGIQLGDNPHFCKDLDSIKSDNEVCKALHSVMYNSVGKKADMKKSLRAFSGFAPEQKDEKKAKVLEKKKIWTVSTLKTALGMFGLEKSGDREALVARMIDYLAEPRFTKDASTTSKKRKSTSKASSKKGAKKSKKSKDGKKRAPSAYILFCKAERDTLRAEQPELSMIDQTRALGALWNALSAEEKENWNEKAREAKAALAADGDADAEEAEEDNEEESEDEDEGEGVELTGDIDFGSDDDENDEAAEDDFQDLLDED
eukprot:gene27399-30968_t